MNAPEAIFSIQLTEAGSAAGLMRDLIKGRGFIMLSHYSLVKVLRGKTYV